MRQAVLRPLFNPSLTINGHNAAGSDVFEVFTPSTGELVGLAPSADAALLDEGVDAARKAFPA